MICPPEIKKIYLDSFEYRLFDYNFDDDLRERVTELGC